MLAKDYKNKEINPRKRCFDDLYEPTCPKKYEYLHNRLNAHPDHKSTILLNDEVRKGGVNVHPDFMVSIMGNIASTADASSPNPIFFTSNPYENRQKAEEIAGTSLDHDVIHTTPVGWFLERLELFNDDVSTIDGDIAYLPWYVAAIRYALSGKPESGDVTIFMDDGDPTSTLYTVELYALLANQDIRTFNGIDKWQYANMASPQLIKYAESILISKSLNEHDENVEGLSLMKKFNRYADRTSSHMVLTDKQCYRYDLISTHLYPQLHNIHNGLRQEQRPEARMLEQHLQPVTQIGRLTDTENYRKLIVR